MVSLITRCTKRYCAGKVSFLHKHLEFIKTIRYHETLFTCGSSLRWEDHDGVADGSGEVEEAVDRLCEERLRGDGWGGLHKHLIRVDINRTAWRAVHSSLASYPYNISYMSYNYSQLVSKTVFLFSILSLVKDVIIKNSDYILSEQKDFTQSPLVFGIQTNSHLWGTVSLR